MRDVFVCDAIRTPIGRYGGHLSGIRTDDLAVIPLRALIARNPSVDWDQLEEVFLGCVNQAGEDNRNVARMASLLAGLPQTVAGVTLNRLCGSGLDAVGSAARAIRQGDGDLIIAGGVESMSRAPFVIPKARGPFSRQSEIHDSTIGWRFINPQMRERFGVESMPETAENIAEAHQITRSDQDIYALTSQLRAAEAQRRGVFAREIIPVQARVGKAQVAVDTDEHPRETSLAALAKLETPFRTQGTVTAGNSSGVNDGACVLILASEQGARRNGLTPRARILGMATAGVAPRLMGLGPVPAVAKLLTRLTLQVTDIDLWELNEAFAAQALAVLRLLGIPDNSTDVNPNGGAIALGHPLGMSGARLVMTAVRELNDRSLRRALCTMCIGVGQGIALALERV